LFHELTGQFHGPARRRWYLSDGGHFENTGCYELLRRRLPVMIICDCGADPDYRFEDLSNFVRKARIDFDAEIQFFEDDELKDFFERYALKKVAAAFGSLTTLYRRFATMPTGFPGAHYSGCHAALGCVRYDISETNGSPTDSFDTLIVVIKPSLTSNEPLDLLQYNFENPAFPQEPTSDQFFDDAQWESYRRLGEHIGHALFQDTNLLQSLLEIVTEERAKQNAPPLA
jgi:hypothetical protein